MTLSTQAVHNGNNPGAVKQNYNAIDAVKFLCSILVFLIHVSPVRHDAPELHNYIYFAVENYICRLAVPFFFVASGFFLFKRMPLDKIDTQLVRNYCFKLLRFLGIWTLVLFIGGTGHLWYLGATVTAVCLVSLCFQKNIKYTHLCILASILYVIGMLGDAYAGLTAPLAEIPLFKAVFDGYSYAFSSTRNGLFMGFLFVLMGAGFGHGYFKLKLKTSFAGFCVSMVVLFCEVLLLKYFDIPKEYNMYIFLVPSVFFLFAFASTLQLKDHPVYIKLRHIGSLVYFIHLIVREFVTLTTSTLYEKLSLGIPQFCIFLIILALTLLCAACIENLSHRERFRWLTCFYL